jgi:hypothetical protein
MPALVVVENPRAARRGRADECREEGLVLITTARTDFELIRPVEDFEVMDPRHW